MRRFSMLSVFVFVMMIITPLISVRYQRVEYAEEKSSPLEQRDVINVMASDNGFIKSVDIKEYLIGCVAGEMSVSYHVEALKAQVVASYTYVKFISYRDKDVLGGADISDDSSVHQSYLDEAERKEKWGNDYEKNEKIISDIVNQMLYSYLSYGEMPAMTVYHNLNSGRTESAENVWGEKIPYLISVASAGDRLSPQYLTEHKVSLEEFTSILKKNKISYTDDFKIDSRFESGCVERVDINGNAISGTDLRKMFSLKSADFDMSVNKDNVVFTCRGNGHFVGMSQYGADYMARQGATYDEILNHYYPGTRLNILKT